MNWNELKDDQMLDKIMSESNEKIVMIFKHSTRCSISAMAINRLERNWKDEEMANVKPYYLDLIRYRSISNEISSKFGVVHQSPQVLLIRNGSCVYEDSHMGINYENIKKLSGELSVN